MDKADVFSNRKATKAKFLKCNIDDEEIDEDTTSMQWSTKAAILFPVSLLCSQQIIDICHMTGSDLFHLADKDTPSTYSDSGNELNTQKNSTQIEGAESPSFNLHLSEIVDDTIFPSRQFVEFVVGDETRVTQWWILAIHWLI